MTAVKVTPTGIYQIENYMTDYDYQGKVNEACSSKVEHCRDDGFKLCMVVNDIYTDADKQNPIATYT